MDNVGQKLDVLDLIINTLREHERALDRTIADFSDALNRILAIQKNLIELQINAMKELAKCLK